jgi:hypothetical protein
LKDLNQQKVDNKKLATVLCEVLGSAAKVDNPIKMYGWYTELHKTGKLVLDASDKKLLYDFLEKNESVFLFVKGQLLEILESPVTKEPAKK